MFSYLVESLQHVLILGRVSHQSRYKSNVVLIIVAFIQGILTVCSCSLRACQIGIAVIFSQLTILRINALEWQGNTKI